MALIIVVLLFFEKLIFLFSLEERKETAEMKIPKMRKAKKEINLEQMSKIGKVMWLRRKFQTKENIEQKNCFSLSLRLCKWEIETFITSLTFINALVLNLKCYIFSSKNEAWKCFDSLSLGFKIELSTWIDQNIRN